MSEELKTSGTITKICDVETGTSKAGKEWKKQTFVLNNGSEYNPEAAFSVFGEDKIKILSQFFAGNKVEVNFNVSSREFNGKFYHNLDAWRIAPLTGATTDNPPVEEIKDLPF